MPASTVTEPEIKAVIPEESPRKRRDRLGSIMVILATCFVLVITPLLVAIFIGVANVGSLSNSIEGSLITSRVLASSAANIDRDVGELRRHSLQVVKIVDDQKAYDSLLDAAARRHSQLRETISKVFPVFESESQEDLTELSDVSGVLIGKFVESPTAQELTPLVDKMLALSDKLLASAKRRVDDEGGRVQAEARQTRQTLSGLLYVALPTALTLIALFTFLISGSLRQISRAIKQLGDSRFEDEIQVRGPADLRALGDELDNLRERLQEAEWQKQRFLRHMSHELKTPLASLLEGTELFVDGSLGALPSAQSEVAGILRSNAQELRHLIENLLDYSAWQSHGSTLRCTPFDLQVLCEQVLDQYRLMMRTRMVVVDQRIVPLDLMADRDKLRTVLSNLLSNAIKYTPSQGTIFLRAYRAGGQILLDVADSGPNIPESERAHVFEPFYTGTPPQQAHLKGSGIGLSLVREYVRAHGGEVNLVDGVYRGAHFRIRMPVAAESGPVRLSA